MVDAGMFLEHAEVFGKDLYGTARQSLDDALEAGHDLMLDIDVQGAVASLGNAAKYIETTRDDSPQHEQTDEGRQQRFPFAAAFWTIRRGSRKASARLQ